MEKYRLIFRSWINKVIEKTWTQIWTRIWTLNMDSNMDIKFKALGLVPNHFTSLKERKIQYHVNVRAH